MSYYKTWMDRSEDAVNQQTYVEYINKYYALEKNAYDLILNSYPDNKEFTSGKAKDLAIKLGFTDDTIKASLKNGDSLDLEAVEDGTDIDLEIDYEKLYYNMRDAKADWLYGLKAWNKVLEDDKMKEITREYREANIAHSNKIGRNDPCPCGSGKKYKNCCGRKI